jgi:hypothetical protein
MKNTFHKNAINEMIPKGMIPQNLKKWPLRPDYIINYLSPLNFYSMKQLILLVLVTGMAATTAFGQLKGSDPRPVTCTNDPLHPIAGKPYDYSAILNPTGGTSFWYATKSTTFVTAGVRSATVIPADGVAILAGATNYGTNGTNATSPSKANLTWTSAGLKGVDAANPMFMVLEYAGPGTPSCANNLKVYQILPKNAFTVDILNIKSNGLTPLAYDATDALFRPN